MPCTADGLCENYISIMMVLYNLRQKLQGSFNHAFLRQLSVVALVLKSKQTPSEQIYMCPVCMRRKSSCPREKYVFLYQIHKKRRSSVTGSLLGLNTNKEVFHSSLSLNKSVRNKSCLRQNAHWEVFSFSTMEGKILVCPLWESQDTWLLDVSSKACRSFQ